MNSDKARPQHRELCSLLFARSLWVLLDPLLASTEKKQETAYSLSSLSEEDYNFSSFIDVKAKGSKISSNILKP